ncbi:MAG: serine/threonine-protein kinase [Myxococcota bacterium]
MAPARQTMSMPARTAIANAQAPTLDSGTRLLGYELLLPIGKGGMAEVWIARTTGELGFSRLVALKTIRPEVGRDPGFRSAFFEEARLAARLRHANAVDVLELGEDGATLFTVMDWIEGVSLAHLLASGPRGGQHLSPAVAVRVVSDLLSGLHAAHELLDDTGAPLALVHRDVSPHNVLVGIEGVARLTDFGVAKAFGRVAAETQAGEIRGKPGYFSPEQGAGLPVDRRTDIFAAGIVLFEALTGRRLFGGGPASAPLAKLTDRTYPSPDAVVSSVPAPIAKVVNRALAFQADERFPTALEMRDALEAAALEAMAIATAKDVAEAIQTRCGAELREQQAKLRARLVAGPTRPSDPAPEQATVVDKPFDAAALLDPPPPMPEPAPPASRWPWAIGLTLVIALLLAWFWWRDVFTL